MVGFAEDTAIKVWKATEDGLTADTICTEMPIDRHTVERLRAVKKGFEVEKTDKQLVTDAWDLDTIKLLRKWWVRYQISKNPEARKRHIQRLMDLSKEFRNRIINPEIEKQMYGTNSSWKWGAQDLRFVPTVWFDIMIPRQDDDKLLERDFPGFQYLKMHLKSSPYWDHYENLKDTINKLEADISKALDTLKTKHKRYIDIDNYRDGLLDFCMDHVWSPKTKLKQDEIGGEYALSTEDYAQLEERYQTLTKYVPNYKKRLDEAEKLLQQIWDDLDPEEIEPIIENNVCNRC
jgi:hypothetical protein